MCSHRGSCITSFFPPHPLFFFVLDLPAFLEPESRALPPCCASCSEEGRPRPAAGLTGAPRAEVEAVGERRVEGTREGSVFR